MDQGGTIRTEIRRSLSLAGPLVLAQLAQMSMTFVDTLMIGRLGSLPLAAGGLGNSVFFPIMIVALGVLASVSPLVSQSYGAGRPGEVSRAVRQGLSLAAGLSIPVFLMTRNAGTVLLALGQDPSVVALTEAYLKAIAWGILPLLGFGVLRHFVEGLSRPRGVMLITFLGVSLNVAGNYILIFGKLGFPPLGLLGCGIASAVVYWSMFLLLLAYIYQDPELKQYQILSPSEGPNRETLQELVRLGWPIGVSHGLESGLFGVTAFLMGLLGTSVLAAHQIALQCAAFTFMVPVGLSLATAVRVGQEMGRRDLDAVQRAGFVGIGLGAAFMCLAAVAFWTVPKGIVSLFLSLEDPANSEVVRMAIPLLGVAAVFQVFDGVQVTAGGALRGLKDTRTPMLVALLAYWLVGFTTGCLLSFPARWGAVGLWWGLVLGLGTAAVLLLARFSFQLRDLRRRQEFLR